MLSLASWLRSKCYMRLSVGIYSYIRKLDSHILLAEALLLAGTKVHRTLGTKGTPISIEHTCSKSCSKCRVRATSLIKIGPTLERRAPADPCM